MELFEACSQILWLSSRKIEGIDFDDIRNLFGCRPSKVFELIVGFDERRPILKTVRRFTLAKPLTMYGIAVGSHGAIINKILNTTNEGIFVSDTVKEILRNTSKFSQTVQSACRYIDFMMESLFEITEVEVSEFPTKNMGLFLLHASALSVRNGKVISHLHKVCLFLNNIHDAPFNVMSTQLIDFLLRELKSITKSSDDLTLSHVYGLYLAALSPFLSFVDNFIGGNYMADPYQEFVIYKRRDLEDLESLQLYADDTSMNVFNDNHSIDRSNLSVFDEVWGQFKLRGVLPEFLNRGAAKKLLNATKCSISLTLLGVKGHKGENITKKVFGKIERILSTRQDKIPGVFECSRGRNYSNNRLAGVVIFEEDEFGGAQGVLTGAFEHKYPKSLLPHGDPNLCLNARPRPSPANEIGSGEPGITISNLSEPVTPGKLHHYLDSLGIDGIRSLVRLHDISVDALQKTCVLYEEWDGFGNVLSLMDPCNLERDRYVSSNYVPFIDLILATNEVINRTIIKKCEREQEAFQTTFIGTFNIREHLNTLLSVMLLVSPGSAGWFHDHIVEPLIPEKGGTGLTSNYFDFLNFQTTKLCETLRSDNPDTTLSYDKSVRVMLTERLDVVSLARSWFDDPELKVSGDEDNCLHLVPQHSLENIDHIVLTYVPFGPFNIMLGLSERMAYLQIGRMLRQRKYCSYVIGHVPINQFKESLAGGKGSETAIWRNVMAFRQMMQTFLFGLERFSYHDALGPLLEFAKNIGTGRPVAIWDIVLDHRMLLSNALESLKIGNNHIVAIMEGVFRFCSLLKEGSSYGELERLMRDVKTMYNALLQLLTELSREGGRHSPANCLLLNIPH